MEAAVWRAPGAPRKGPERARGWVRAVRDAVADGVPIMLGLLDDPAVEFRRMAPYTLAAFPDRDAEIVPRLRGGASRTLPPG